MGGVEGVGVLRRSGCGGGRLRVVKATPITNPCSVRQGDEQLMYQGANEWKTTH